MRTIIFALAAVVSAFAINRAGAADEIPAFNIARNCQEETDGTPGSPCAADETQAEHDLTERWHSYNASQKEECVGESSIGGERSYVELLTCLELSKGQLDPN